MTQLARSSRCDRALVQILHGHFKNGRQVEDFRCDRHMAAEAEIGTHLTYAPTGSSYTLDRIDAIAAEPALGMADVHETGVQVVESSFLDAPLSRETPAAAGFRCDVTANGLVLLDVALRTFMAKSGDGSYWHQIRPSVTSDWVVQEGRRAQGQLICTCESGRVRGWCYRVVQADRWLLDFEAEHRWDSPQRELAGASA